jgi:hypothetical protein
MKKSPRVAAVGRQAKGLRLIRGLAVLSVFVVTLVIGLVTHGVPPVLGLLLAVLGALVIDGVLFRSRR